MNDLINGFGVLSEVKLKRSKSSTEEVAITKDYPTSTASPAKVDTIIKTLSALESDIDSLGQNLADMKKQLNQKAQREIEKLTEQVSQMATKEAEAMISEAREKAKSESQRILTAADINLKDVQNKIDSKFNEAVEVVVSTVLKA
jgi:vacuolar-type H+-ATPase subunit H